MHAIDQSAVAAQQARSGACCDHARDPRACSVAVGAFFGWYKFFREEPQPDVDHATIRRCASSTARSAPSATPASRTGSSMCCRACSRRRSRAGRVCLVRRVVGAGTGAADRLHQEGDRLPARGEQLRRVPHRELSQEPRTRTRRSSTPGPAHTLNRRSVLPLPRRLRQGSALQRRQPHARDQARHRLSTGSTG